MSKIPRRLWDCNLAGSKTERKIDRWKEEVLRDVNTIRVKEYKKTARERTEWRRTVHKAMGLLGLFLL